MNNIRFVALIAIWSYDYWDEINHEDPTFRCLDEGPSSYRHCLVRTFQNTPCQIDICNELRILQQEMSLLDGHGEIHSYAVVDDCAWMRLLGALGEDVVGLRDETEPNFLLCHHSRLATANEAWKQADIDATLQERGKNDERSPANRSLDSARSVTEPQN